MADLRDLIPKSESSQDKISGHFMCQVCGESVYEATNNRAKKLAVWTCSNKHRSSMEWDF